MKPWVSLTSLLLVAVVVLAACGSAGRRLRTVTLTPPIADAKNFPNGTVQFIATGTFDKPPSPVQLTSKDVTWCVGSLTNILNPTTGICAGNVAQFASVDQNGAAQCGSSNLQASMYILAGIPLSAPNPDEGQAMKVYGSATLTCP